MNDKKNIHHFKTKTMKDKLTKKQRWIWLLPIAIILTFVNKCNAQPEPYKLIFEVGADIKMLTLGSHPGEDKNIKGLDFIVGFGFEWESIRITNQFQSFQKLGFYKWTYLKPDYKITVNDFYIFAGLEMSAIKRTHKEALRPRNPQNVFGANLEIQYRLNNVAIGIQGNIHQAEDDLKPYKDYRKQAHLKLIYLF